MTIESRLSSLERSRNRWRWGAVVAVAVASVAFLSAAARRGGPDFEKLTVRELRVVNAEGTTVAALDSLMDHGSLMVRTKSGSVILASGKDGSPVFLMNDEAGAVRLSLEVTKDLSQISLWGTQKEGGVRARLSSLDEYGALMLMAKNTRHLFILPDDACRELHTICWEDHPIPKADKQEPK